LPSRNFFFSGSAYTLASPASSPAATQRPFCVAIIDKNDASVEAAALARRLGGEAKVRVQALDIRTQAQALANPILPFADAVMVWHTINIDADMVRRMPKAHVLVRVGVGYDNVDLKACAAAGLPVCNVPNYGTEEVADHAMSLVLALFRRTFFSAQRAERGEEAHGSDGVAAIAKGTRRIRGCTFGVLGCGRIGTATALRAKAFGFEVVFYDPFVPAGLDKALGVRRVASARALAECSDVLSVHCDLNETSRGLVDGPLMRSMKRGSFVVNTARGGIVDERALRVLLDDGHIAGAGIDVHEIEPYVGTDPSKQPLAHAPNCICTPHSAFFSEEAFVEMRTLASDSAADSLLAIPLANCVNAAHLDEAVKGSRASAGGDVAKLLAVRSAVMRQRGNA